MDLLKLVLDVMADNHHWDSLMGLGEDNSSCWFMQYINLPDLTLFGVGGWQNTWHQNFITAIWYFVWEHENGLCP